MHSKPRFVLLLTLATGAAACAQLPQAPTAPWNPPGQLRLHAPAEAPAFQPPHASDPAQPLSLAELIDLAEQRNPETRAAWNQAKAALALKGIARSALYPTLTGLVISQTTRNGVLFNAAFVRQTEGLYEPALELEYTVFDWNGRVDALRAARYDLYASDYAFNNVHLQVIDTVTRSYFALLDSIGQVAAAKVNLQNATTVAAAVDARLAEGLATLPDALEARAAAAQATSELANLQGAQSNAQATLATTLRLPASTVLPVLPIDQLAPPQALAGTVEDAIARALAGRPDLLQQEARIAAADQRLRQARTAYAPRIVFSGNWGRVRAFGEQDLLPETYAAAGVWNAQLNFSWTLFDGGRRASDVARAIAEKASAEAELDADRDRIEDQVWTAYTNTATAFRQQQAAEALLGAAQSSFAAATEAYNDGVRTLVDTVSAQRTLAEALSQEISARTNLFQQAAELTYRTGELLRVHSGPATLAPGTVQPGSPLLTTPAGVSPLAPVAPQPEPAAGPHADHSAPAPAAAPNDGE